MAAEIKKTFWRDNRGAFLAAAVIVGVFIVDSATPQGFDVWLLYFLPILLNFPIGSRYILLFPLAVSVFTFAGFYLSPSYGMSFFALVNRVFGMGLLWFAVVGMKRRVIIEERLRESESRYRAFFELAGAGAIEIDPWSNCFLRVNSAFSRITGYSAQELARMTYVDLTFPEDRGRDKDTIPRLLRGEIPAYIVEKRYVRKDGSVVWVRVSATMVWDRQGKPLRIVGIVSDINELKLGHEALHREQFLLQTIFDTVPVMFALYDSRLKKLKVNPQLLKVLGWTSADVDAQDFTAKVCPDPRYRHEIEEYMRSTSSGYRDILMTAKDGSRIETSWAVVTLPDGRLVGIGLDNRDRKRAEEELRRAEEHLRLAVEAGDEGTWDYDLLTDKIVIGRRGRAILGLPSDKPVSFAGSIATIHAADRERVEKSLQRALSPLSDGNYNAEYRVFHPDGTIHWVSERGKSYFSGEGTARKAFRFIGIVRDITDSKRVEEVLKRDKATFERLVKERSEKLFDAQRELDRSRRLSDIGTFAATIAHELRNPLAAIELAGASIRRKARDAVIEASSDNIRKKVDESNRIIDDLLYFTRMRAPAFAEVEVFDLLKESVKTARERRPDSKSRVEVDLEPLYGVTIRADAGQLAEVFANLLNNAFEAIPTHREGCIGVFGRLRKGTIEISIKDNGPGIPEEAREKIFEPFFTTKKKGTGLGLSVVSQIVRMHKGSIAVESETGKGTTMTVTLLVDPETRL